MWEIYYSSHKLLPSFAQAANFLPSVKLENGGFQKPVNQTALLFFFFKKLNQIFGLETTVNQNQTGWERTDRILDFI